MIGSSDTNGAPALHVPLSFVDQIAQILQQEILDGKYVHGAHLQQDELCSRFGVSRTPAREALRKLQALNLVQLIPNRGARVQMPTLNELSEVYKIRAELEGFAAALAAERRTDEIAERLVGAQRNLREAVDRLNATDSADSAADQLATGDALKQFNDAFHQGVHSASGNARLESLIEDLQRYFPKDVVRWTIRSPDKLRQFYVNEHDAVLTAIVEGRPDAARRAMCEHIHQAEGMLISYLRDRGYGERSRI